MSKQFKDLTIKDAFMFAAVMSDPEECRRLLQLILDMDILEVQVIAEKTMAYHPEYHGIRLDVLAEEQGTKRRFNIEMQVKSQKDLPRRSRLLPFPAGYGRPCQRKTLPGTAGHICDLYL